MSPSDPGYRAAVMAMQQQLQASGINPAQAASIAGNAVGSGQSVDQAMAQANQMQQQNTAQDAQGKAWEQDFAAKNGQTYDANAGPMSVVAGGGASNAPIMSQAPRAQAASTFGPTTPIPQNMRGGPLRAGGMPNGNTPRMNYFMNPDGSMAPPTGSMMGPGAPRMSSGGDPMWSGGAPVRPGDPMASIRGGALTNNGWLGSGGGGGADPGMSDINMGLKPYTGSNPSIGGPDTWSMGSAGGGSNIFGTAGSPSSISGRPLQMGSSSPASGGMNLAALVAALRGQGYGGAQGGGSQFPGSSTPMQFF